MGLATVPHCRVSTLEVHRASVGKLGPGSEALISPARAAAAAVTGTDGAIRTAGTPTVTGMTVVPLKGRESVSESTEMRSRLAASGQPEPGNRATGRRGGAAGQSSRGTWAHRPPAAAPVAPGPYEAAGIEHEVQPERDAAAPRHGN